MSAKIRMNTEYRNKLYNRIKDVFEKEDTQERQAFMEARNFNLQRNQLLNLQKRLLKGHTHQKMLLCCVLSKEYGQPCDVVAKDKCFYFAHNEDVDDEGKNKKLNHILILVL